METTKQSSSFSLLLMNLFIGMTKGVVRLPRVFVDLGYACRGVEVRFQNAAGELVRPELILGSGLMRHTLAFEWKQGPNTERDQLRRYGGILGSDLQAKALLPAAECEKHDITVVGFEEYADRLALAIDDSNYGFVLVVKTRDGLKKVRNNFAPPRSLSGIRFPERRINDLQRYGDS